MTTHDSRCHLSSVHVLHAEGCWDRNVQQPFCYASISLWCHRSAALPTAGPYRLSDPGIASMKKNVRCRCAQTLKGEKLEEPCASAQGRRTTPRRKRHECIYLSVSRQRDRRVPRAHAADHGEMGRVV